MYGMLRRARGLLAVGLTWGVLWGLIGYAIGLLVGVLDPDSIDEGESPGLIGVIIGCVGFLSGCCFAFVLSLAERSKGVLDLSPLRAALWGALGAAAPLLLSGLPDGMVPITAPLGAAFAAGTVAMARRAARHDAARDDARRDDAAPADAGPAGLVGRGRASA
jgi:hypothetical protein